MMKTYVLNGLGNGEKKHKKPTSFCKINVIKEKSVLIVRKNDGKLIGSSLTQTSEKERGKKQ